MRNYLADQEEKKKEKWLMFVSKKNHKVTLKTEDQEGVTGFLGRKMYLGTSMDILR